MPARHRRSATLVSQPLLLPQPAQDVASPSASSLSPSSTERIIVCRLEGSYCPLVGSVSPTGLAAYDQSAAWLLPTPHGLLPPPARDLAAGLAHLDETARRIRRERAEQEAAEAPAPSPE